ncbi:hypothetical protein ACFFX1_10890 [Dactylosporangium sucinum]|uniref:Uncharacterized protein n=1 Tax=Dactylosporangium sucinum TaxID=1424081 RepID=A0A917THI2_9ACTN|nr:hypothetical protein [Dactylosporangium sucinum]GGM22823.1 hypothetical protein GCM10007977_025020 [Dactylosporangium sucinum]
MITRGTQPGDPAGEGPTGYAVRRARTRIDTARRAGFGFTVAGHSFGLLGGVVWLGGTGIVWRLAGGRAADFPALLDTLQQGAPLSSWHWQPVAAGFAAVLAGMIGDGFEAASRWALRRAHIARLRLLRRPAATNPADTSDPGRTAGVADSRATGTAARWIVTEFDEAGAWLGEYDGQTELDGGADTDACQAAAAVYALWWEPTWLGVRHHRAEVVTADGAYGVACAARRLIRPIESLQDAEWSVELVDADHEHQQRPVARPDRIDNDGLTGAHAAELTDGGWLPIVRVDDLHRWNAQLNTGDER